MTFQVLHAASRQTGHVLHKEICFEPKLAHFENHSLPITVRFDMPIKPKLAETALLFYRVTDVPFLPKMNQNRVNDVLKMVRSHFLTQNHEKPWIIL